MCVPIRKLVHSPLVPFVLGVIYFWFEITNTVIDQSTPSTEKNGLPALAFALLFDPIGLMIRPI